MNAVDFSIAEILFSITYFGTITMICQDFKGKISDFCNQKDCRRLKTVRFKLYTEADFA